MGECGAAMREATREVTREVTGEATGEVTKPVERGQHLQRRQLDGNVLHTWGVDWHDVWGRAGSE